MDTQIVEGVKVKPQECILDRIVEQPVKNSFSQCGQEIVEA